MMLNTHDPDQLLGVIAGNSRELFRARNSLEGYLEHWIVLAENVYKGVVVIDLTPGESPIARGTVAGKHFAVHAHPVVIDQRAYLEVSVTAEFPGLDLRSLAAQFLVSGSGDIHQVDGQKAIDALDATPNYRLLSNVLAQVLNTSTPAISG